MLRAADKWLIPYLSRKIPSLAPGPVHLMLCVCDHFEPLHDTDLAGAESRLRVWQDSFPALTAAFRDADGHPPKHTFFYPVEQYHEELVGPLSDLCAATGSEVEIHLHHHNDTVERFRESLETGKAVLLRHGLLAEDPLGRTVYGFIHGNWALNNSAPGGKGCGVDREIPILRATGCYADFTMPSAPHPTQTRTINSLYYAADAPRRKAHDSGTPVAVGQTARLRQSPDHLLLVQGPLAPDWRRRKWGLIPKLENGDLTGANPPSLQRLLTWTAQRIQVQGQPNWIFVKLHTHGGIPRNYGTLLGEKMRAFHEALGRFCQDSNLSLHYVTARELVNILHAAEDGLTNPPGDHRNHLYRRSHA